MRKWSIVLAAGVLFGGLLAGCGNAGQSKDSQTANQQQQNENENYPLNHIGQKVTDSRATAELVKMKKVNETVNLKPVNVLVKDVKVIKLTNMKPQWLEELSNMTDKIKMHGAVYYLQVQMSVENTTNKHVEFHSLNKIVTDQGDKLNPQMNISPSNYTSDIKGKMTQEDTYGLVLGGGRQDIHKVTLYFGAVKDAAHHAIHQGGKLAVSLD